ncbi:MAG: hypothetical protein AAF609_15430 [Cyanobacteria bacterium P01_C01_bin.120]
MTVRRASIWVFSLNFLAIILALIVHYLGGRDPFGERGFISFLSVAQLLAIAWLAHKIFQLKACSKLPFKKSAKLFWRTVTWGFVFLAADEFLSIHEVTDLLIHDIFSLQETPVTDRIDDVIVGLYGIFGAAMVWLNRHEITVHQRAVSFLRRGFLLLIIMVAIDAFSNDQGFLERFLLPSTADIAQHSLYQLEDSLKILIEAFFIMAFYAIFTANEQIQKRLEHSQRAFQSESEELINPS